jgi:TrmH family RNA methyltransferase
LPPRKIREIESPSNSLIKVFRRALKEGTTREGLIACEGPLLLEEALKTLSGPESQRCTINTVLASRTGADKFASLLENLPEETELVQVPDQLFERLAQTEASRGIAALIEFPDRKLEGILAQPRPCLLVACGIQDPGNLGTMIRSLHALGGSALIALRSTVSPFNPKTLRSSAGAIFRVPVFRDLDSSILFSKLHSAGVTIAAADRYGSTPLTEADLGRGIAFLIGREGGGLDKELLNAATVRLSIPIRPDTDSVNAGVAASILLYEAGRQRGFAYC